MFARKRGSAWEAWAPAKLNLYLEVFGRRADGFHDLETVMAPIDVYDRLAWSPVAAGQPRFSFDLHWSTPPALAAAIPTDETNLVVRAVKVLGRTAGIEPYGRFTLLKRIPAQAGLGGGSSDAAAALTLANAAWGVHYPTARLATLAAELGSDVPFFLDGGWAICRGRGELLEPLPAMPPVHLVVVAPNEGVSTAEAFRRLDAVERPADDRAGSARRVATLVERIRSSGRNAEWGQRLANRFQAVAAEMCPAIGRLGEAFARLSCQGWAMTGSGSACYGAFLSAPEARRAARLLSSWKVGAAFAVRACHAQRCKET